LDYLYHIQKEAPNDFLRFPLFLNYSLSISWGVGVCWIIVIEANLNAEGGGQLRVRAEDRFGAVRGRVQGVQQGGQLGHRDKGDKAGEHQR
jgi:hypothetical protein